MGSAFRSDTSRMSAAVRLSSACFVALRFHFWVRATSAFGMEVWPSSWPWTHCVADAGRCEAGDERTTAQPGVGAGGEPVLGVFAKGEGKNRRGTYHDFARGRLAVQQVVLRHLAHG